MTRRVALREIAHALTSLSYIAKALAPTRPPSYAILKLLLEAPEGTWYGPADFSNDDRLVLVQQFVNVDDSRILVFRLKSHVVQYWK